MYIQKDIEIKPPTCARVNANADYEDIFTTVYQELKPKKNRSFEFKNK